MNQPQSLEELEASEMINVTVLELHARRYEDGIFRRLGNRLKTELPKPDAEKRGYWQLSDDLQDSLILLLFPAVYEDRAKFVTVLAAFEEETGAEAKSKWSHLRLRRSWYENSAA